MQTSFWMLKRPWITAVAVLLGLVSGQLLPNTFLRNPIATVKLMRSLPLGSHVVPRVAGEQTDNQIGRPNWGDYGIVIGYEAIKGLDDQSILLCIVRMQNGGGPVLAINPFWLSRANQGGELSSRRSGEGSRM